MHADSNTKTHLRQATHRTKTSSGSAAAPPDWLLALFPLSHFPGAVEEAVQGVGAVVEEGEALRWHGHFSTSNLDKKGRASQAFEHSESMFRLR